MPNASIKNSTNVPTEEAIIRAVLKQIQIQKEIALIDPSRRFKRILEEARRISEETGAPCPPGIYRGKER